MLTQSHLPATRHRRHCPAQPGGVQRTPGGPCSPSALSLVEVNECVRSPGRDLGREEALRSAGTVPRQHFAWRAGSGDAILEWSHRTPGRPCGLARRPRGLSGGTAPPEVRGRVSGCLPRAHAEDSHAVPADPAGEAAVATPLNTQQRRHC